LRLNVRFSALGVPEDFKGFSVFPYLAPSLVSGKKAKFNNLDDVKEEMTNIMANKLHEGTGNIGRVLYEGLPFFANASNFVDSDNQLLIKKFQYCQLTNTPPFPSLDKTPAKIVEDFTTIDSEINAIQKEIKTEGANNGS